VVVHWWFGITSVAIMVCNVIWQTHVTKVVYVSSANVLICAHQCLGRAFSSSLDTCCREPNFRQGHGLQGCGGSMRMR
jgi:hypothetical protein